ncbi:sulfur oxidation c-type cytochrome SoxX [Thiocapsa bogorovii]|uniref:sulfur oxidation c-type cytochrome SoxX n=1 Tax=Thiocapsa bogorovii TaxID=521689 RepID=UPI001E507592|nr:sulfur oxidation c-type cytochrome SoxX [Thiocapsa bogorovii]UHD16316.1 sulfur oxidation c-type cytochrome SoxX [Thiocapsa bogorovii]
MLSQRPIRASAIALGLGLSTLAVVAAATDMPQLDLNGDAAAGKAVAEDRGKGNCIACHMIVGAESPGAIGPALIAMQTRYPTKEALARQIWDATVKTPEAAMPPFGKHEILTNQEFVDVVEYVWTL